MKGNNKLQLGDMFSQRRVHENLKNLWDNVARKKEKTVWRDGYISTSLNTTYNIHTIYYMHNSSKLIGWALSNSTD
jgi:hypothetical protein